MASCAYAHPIVWTSSCHQLHVRLVPPICSVSLSGSRPGGILMTIVPAFVVRRSPSWSRGLCRWACKRQAKRFPASLAWCLSGSLIIFHRHRLHRAPEVPRTTSSSSLCCSGPQLRTGSWRSGSFGASAIGEGSPPGALWHPPFCS